MRIHLSKLSLLVMALLVLTSLFILTPASAKEVHTHSVHAAQHASIQATVSEPNFNPETDIKPLTDTRQNYYPIVLVDGFLGFGRNEFYGYKYWGGFSDIQADLNTAGYTTYTASIGPISSNWERACELYAMIKGGRVDYGQAHANKFGITRYGRTYPGFYPQWGEVNPDTGTINKVHLLAHSMGGQTVRLLAQLLEQGSADEQAATPPDQLSPLFAGSKPSWIESIFTISSPENGTTMTSQVHSLLPFAQQLLTFIAAIQGYHQVLDYDLQLDQWGLMRQPGESLSSYLTRVEHSGLWQDTNDNAGWDVSPEGAEALNQWVKAQPDIYYFSVATQKTHEENFTHHQVPDLSMSPFEMPTAFYMGAYTQDQPGMVPVDSSWWPNDGVVNTNSMAGPTIDSTDQIVPYAGMPTQGVWNYLGTMQHYDHTEVLGRGSRDMRSWYRGIASFLASLPA